MVITLVVNTHVISTGSVCRDINKKGKFSPIKINV